MNEREIVIKNMFRYIQEYGFERSEQMFFNLFAENIIQYALFKCGNDGIEYKLYLDIKSSDSFYSDESIESLLLKKSIYFIELSLYIENKGEFEKQKSIIYNIEKDISLN